MAEKNTEQTPIIFLDNISVTFKSRTGSLFHPNLVHAVNGLTLKLMPGETIGIVGESGCGKSTTANVMCGLQSPTDGHVYFKGDDVTKRTAELRKKIGRVVSVVFQNPATALNPRMSVHDQLLDPLVVHNYGLHFWIALLIIFGGLGFPIVFNYLGLCHHFLRNGLKMLLGKQKRYIHAPHIINVHTYIVVISTLLLLVTGTVAYLCLENGNTLRDLPWYGKLADAFLGAVTPRTAGFNVASMSALAPATLMLTLVLMVVGAAPMSTGGGLKVTTVFVALATTLNAAREKSHVEVRGREISPATIRRAFAIISLYFIWVAVATSILSCSEKDVPLFTLLFEVVSALSTVGLSIDYTPRLSTFGKIVIITTMLIGRIGVLAFLVSFCKEYKEKNYTYPQENILM